eukprot:1155994-Pelagomonas_calceolata.AAC.3
MGPVQDMKVQDRGSWTAHASHSHCQLGGLAGAPCHPGTDRWSAARWPKSRGRWRELSLQRPGESKEKAWGHERSAICGTGMTSSLVG